MGTENTEHTPTPWEDVIKEDKYGQELLIVHGTDDEYSEVICGAFSNPANAAFIVKACNLHDELVEALKDLLELHEDATDNRKRKTFAEEGIEDYYARVEKQARSALAKARSVSEAV